MKNILACFNAKSVFTGLILVLLQFTAMAQDSTSVNINADQVESWFSQNWMWVAIGAVVLIVLIAMLSSGSAKSSVKKTTIVKEEDATGVVKTTTTEITE